MRARSHADKLEIFGTTQKVRDELMEFSDVVGIPQVTFKLLGIPYNTSRAVPVVTSSITDKLEKRCKRIQICGHSYALRSALLGKLVIPLFRWCSSWIKKLTARWAGAIERAMCGGAIPRDRSRALSWTTSVGLHLFPDYVNAAGSIVVCCWEGMRARPRRPRRHSIFLAGGEKMAWGTAGTALSRQAQLRLPDFAGCFEWMGLANS